MRFIVEFDQLRIATVAIVFSHCVKLGQDVDLIDGDLASLAMYP